MHEIFFYIMKCAAVTMHNKEVEKDVKYQRLKYIEMKNIEGMEIILIILE